MEKYKVLFYFGVYRVNPFLAPSKIVEIEVSNGLSENEIILAALKTLDRYPRTYSASVTKI